MNLNKYTIDQLKQLWTQHNMGPWKKMKKQTIIDIMTKNMTIKSDILQVKLSEINLNKNNTKQSKEQRMTNKSKEWIIHCFIIVE